MANLRQAAVVTVGSARQQSLVATKRTQGVDVKRQWISEVVIKVELSLATNVCAIRNLWIRPFVTGGRNPPIPWLMGVWSQVPGMVSFATDKTPCLHIDSRYNRYQAWRPVHLVAARVACMIQVRPR